MIDDKQFLVSILFPNIGKLIYILKELEQSTMSQNIEGGTFYLTAQIYNVYDIDSDYAIDAPKDIFPSDFAPNFLTDVFNNGATNAILNREIAGEQTPEFPNSSQLPDFQKRYRKLQIYCWNNSNKDMKRIDFLEVNAICGYESDAGIYDKGLGIPMCRLVVYAIDSVGKKIATIFNEASPITRPVDTEYLYSGTFHPLSLFVCAGFVVELILDGALTGGWYQGYYFKLSKFWVVSYNAEGFSNFNISDESKTTQAIDGVLFNDRHVILYKNDNINKIALSKISEYDNFSQDSEITESSAINVSLNYDNTKNLGLIVDRYLYAFSESGIFVMGSDNGIITPMTFKILYQRKANLFPVKPTHNKNGIYCIDTDYNLNGVQYDYSTDNLNIVPLSLFFNDMIYKKDIKSIIAFGDKVLITFDNTIVVVNWLQQQQILSSYYKEYKYNLTNICYSEKNNTLFLSSNNKILYERKYEDNRFLDYYKEYGNFETELTNIDLMEFDGKVGIYYTMNGKNFFYKEAEGGQVLGFERPFIFAIAGYNYDCLIELLQPMTEQILNQKGKIKTASIQMIDTKALSVSQDGGQEVVITGRRDETFNEEERGFDGYYDVNVFSGSSKPKTLQIKSSLPFKACITNIINTIEFGDK
jgi:hypothetical protein